MDKKYKYNKANTDVEKSDQKDEKSDKIKKKSPWNNICGKIRILAPYLWPTGNVFLQCVVFAVFLLIVSLRVVNVFVPRLQRDIIDILAQENSPFPYDTILIYSVLKFLQGFGGGQATGFLISLKNILWKKVEQNTYKKLKLGLFDHVHRLGARWHQSRVTGELLRIMDRGTAAAIMILKTALFSMVPVIIDAFVAIGALSFDLNIYFGLIILLTICLYIPITVIGTEFRTKFNRKKNQADNEQRGKSVDSLLNSGTVKLYGNEDYESEKFSNYLDTYLNKEWIASVFNSSLNLVQLFILACCLMSGSLYGAYLISQHQLTVGDYVLFITYMTQMIQPINQLSRSYKEIQEALVNMENMLELMDEEEEIKDIPDAVEFLNQKTDIIFENVSFHYEIQQPILKKVSFKVPDGTSLAIVGPSGSGKSTLINLLLRFYDPIEGKILIGDQDVKHMKQNSLRKKIGVVPQDVVLFNETIEHNIKYSSIDSTIEDVIKAAKVADVHDKILTFPEEYATKVGERGLKLSGGEKQRVAIARTILRSPKLIILDEATSALDSSTEQNIQTAFEDLFKNRTCIIIAHRLSTVKNADQIIVLKNGEVSEQGNHEQLLSAGGLYSEMWNLQQTSGVNTVTDVSNASDSPIENLSISAGRGRGGRGRGVGRGRR